MAGTRGAVASTLAVGNTTKEGRPTPMVDAANGALNVDGPTTRQFTTEIELHGTTATGFQVPLDVVRALGPGKKPKVLVTIGRHTYRSTVAVYGGVPMLPLSAENRTAAGVSAGETVEVGLALDTMERTVDVPADLAAALAERDGARESFDVLSYSRQRAYVQTVEGAKAADTRARRIARVVEELSP